MEGCGTKYQMSRSPEHKHRLGSTDFALIEWAIGPYLITFEKKHPVYCYELWLSSHLKMVATNKPIHTGGTNTDNVFLTETGDN